MNRVSPEYPKPDLEKNVVVEVERIGEEVLLRVGFTVMGMTPEEARELGSLLVRMAGPT